ncbi:hypothetical protein MtrunA17_Chr1g0172551 [Medicago truncatula]|uniref:Uncharacterized protein n=1 Tax=Medicago truncatula TaxID=3880 RepID=A0A396JLA4_MEDTR|nr:hypothetical protein MtrunA17_Chr1g0172551 [Medicago truncatula]
MLLIHQYIRSAGPHSVSRTESPDLKVVSFTDSLLTHTSAQSAPERLLLGSDVNLQKMTSQNSASCFKPAKRVLDFTLTKGIDDLENRAEKSKPSRGCSDDFRSFDSVSLPQEVDENLSHSFQKINVNQHCLDASDNNPSSLVELVNVTDSIFGIL